MQGRSTAGVARPAPIDGGEAGGAGTLAIWSVSAPRDRCSNTPPNRRAGCNACVATRSEALPRPPPHSGPAADTPMYTPRGGPAVPAAAHSRPRRGGDAKCVAVSKPGCCSCWRRWHPRDGLRQRAQRHRDLHHHRCVWWRHGGGSGMLCGGGAATADLAAAGLAAGGRPAPVGRYGSCALTPLTAAFAGSGHPMLRAVELMRVAVRSSAGAVPAGLRFLRRVWCVCAALCA
jgi:hypothetical protein